MEYIRNIRKGFSKLRRSNKKTVSVRKFRSSPNIGRSESSLEKLNKHHSVQDSQTIDEISVAESGDSKSVISNGPSFKHDQYGDETTSVKHIDTEDNLDLVSQTSDPSFGSDHGIEAEGGPDPWYFRSCISSQLRYCSRESLLSQDDTDSTSGYGTLHGSKNQQSDHGQTFKGSHPDWKEIFSSRNSLHSRNERARSTSREDVLNENDTTFSNNRAVNLHIYGSHTSIQANIETGTDDSRMSRSASRPQMVVVNRGSQALKSIADSTECQLRPFEDEKARVLTSVDKHATEMLTRKSGDAVVVIVGHEYDGKSYAAKCTQARLTHNWDNAIINFPEEIDEIQIDEEVRTCILKDDLFGKAEFSKREFEKWQPRFDDMLSKVRARRIGLIFVINRGVFESYTSQHNRHELFNEENILDLTGKHKLSKDDRRGILKCQLQRFPKAKVVFTDDIDKDNVQTFTFEGDLRIYEGYLEQILEVPYTYGFPKQAERYASSLGNIKLREKFFIQPMSFHCLTISKIRKSNKTCNSQSAFAIETTFALKGKVNLDKVTENYNKMMSPRQYQKIGNRTGSESRASENTLFDCAFSRRKAGTDAGDLFRKGLVYLDNWILSRNKDDDTIEFSAPVIYNAIALELSKEYEVDVIRMAPWNFIETCIRPEGNQNKNMFLSVYKQPKKSPLKEELYRRFYYEVTKHSNVAGVCGHFLFKRKWFTDGLFEYLVTKRRMTEFITATDKQTERSILFHGMHDYVDVSESDAHNVTEYLIKSFKWREHVKHEQHKRKHEKEALLESCKTGKYTTFLCLKKHLDKTCLKLAVEAGSIDITKSILREKRFICFSSLSDLLAIACKKHCKTSPRTAKGLARLLMENDCSIDRKDNTHDPLIHDAVRENNTELTKLLLELNCYVDIKDKNGNRPLHKCVLFDSTECAKLLLEFRADISKVNSQGMSPLHLAVTQGSIRIVTALCRDNKSINVLDNKGQTSLSVAVQTKRSPDLLNIMIKYGADVNILDKQGFGPLHYAIFNEHTQGVPVLVRAGALIGNQDKNTVSPIKTAMENKAHDLVMCLLENKKEISCEENDVLFDLIRYGDVNLIQVAIAKGCFLENKNSDGETVLKCAIETQNFDLVNFICESCPALIHIESNGMMPIHTAIVNSSFEICNFLIASGASVLSTTSVGDSPLHIACIHGRMDVVELLLQLDKNLLELLNSDGQTPLHKAAEHGQLQIVQILLILKANPHARTKGSRKKPLDVALAKRNFHNNSSKSIDMEMIKVYDDIVRELRKRMFGRS